MLEKVVEKEGIDVSKIRSPVLRNYMSDSGYGLSKKKKGGSYFRKTTTPKHSRTTYSRRVTPCSFFWP